MEYFSRIPGLYVPDASSHLPHPQRSAKPSEKPRLRQIPSAEDLETDSGSVGPLQDDGLEHRESSHGQQEARGQKGERQLTGHMWGGEGREERTLRHQPTGKGETQGREVLSCNPLIPPH